MKNDYLTLNEIRVMQQYETGRGNYTRDRHKWLPKQNVKELGRQIMDENAQPRE